MQCHIRALTVGSERMALAVVSVAVVSRLV